MDVKVYATSTCPYCRMAKEFLKEKKTAFTEIDVGADPAGAQEMIKISGQMGVPLIVINGEIIVGFDRPAIEKALAGKPGAGPAADVFR